MRFWNWHDAMRSIQCSIIQTLEDVKISVSMAKYAKGRNRHKGMTTKKGQRQAMKRSSQVWRKKKHATGETQAKAPKWNSEV